METDWNSSDGKWCIPQTNWGRLRWIETNWGGLRRIEADTYNHRCFSWYVFLGPTHCLFIRIAPPAQHEPMMPNSCIHAFRRWTKTGGQHIGIKPFTWILTPWFCAHSMRDVLQRSTVVPSPGLPFRFAQTWCIDFPISLDLHTLCALSCLDLHKMCALICLDLHKLCALSFLSPQWWNHWVSLAKNYISLGFGVTG